MTTYFVLYVKDNEATSLLGTHTVDGEDLLLTTDNSFIQLTTVKFPSNMMNGVTVNNALGLTYKDTDTDTVFPAKIVYVPIDTEWWLANQVRGGFEFETDHPGRRFSLNSSEEIEEARWWNSSMTGQSWEDLALKVRQSYSDKSIKVTALEKEAYEVWG